MTALEKIIVAMIESDGPMALDRYTGLCLGHPQHGYYMTRDPFGQGGDFTTAPEVSQVFGELIGVWCLSVWHMMGEPRLFALVELGPGRGTLMADVLRVLARHAKCRKAASVHFVETSPVLRDAQRARVPDATWHAGVASLPTHPTVFVANEFFDALPIRQFERVEGRLFERCVGVAHGQLTMGHVPTPFSISMNGDGIIEDSRLRDAFAAELGHHLETAGGAGLVFDYGHARTSFGDTLQAMRNHGFAHVLKYPGEQDITSHVDFENLAKGFAAGGAKPVGLMTQGDFLNAMGLEQRTAVLVNGARGEAKQNLALASERLAHPGAMGHLFKVMAVTGAELSAPYPFGAA